MSTLTRTSPAESVRHSSIAAKLLDVVASPGEVFKDVAGDPPRSVNWLAPTILVCVSGLLLEYTPVRHALSTDATQQTIATNAQALTKQMSLTWLAVSAAIDCLAVFAGTIWAAFVLWFVGRTFLRTPFSFLKALEVVGLTSVILVLGNVVSILLAWCFGDATPPRVLFLVSDMSTYRAPRDMALNTIGLFHLWSAVVLAIGLSKLSRTSVKEAAFWVFGYWILLRLTFILLAPPP